MEDVEQVTNYRIIIFSGNEVNKSVFFFYCFETPHTRGCLVQLVVPHAKACARPTAFLIRDTLKRVEELQTNKQTNKQTMPGFKR